MRETSRGPDLDLKSRRNVQDPFPLYARLRDHDPVHWSESLNAWGGTRYEDVVQIFDRPATFSADRFRKIDERYASQRPAVRAVAEVLGHWLVFRDPPDHDRLRGLLAAAGPRARARSAALEADDLPPRARVAAAHLGIRMKAAVMRAIGEPLRIEEIEVDTPGPREVVVRTAATGVCHSDLHVLEGSLPNPLPTVLGHEPGVVEDVGQRGATRGARRPRDRLPLGLLRHVRVLRRRAPEPLRGRGDHAPHGRAPPRLAQDGEPALVRIPPDVPLDRVALIGCGVTTGLGAVFNTARVRAGRSVAGIGCGGIGLSVVQGCRIAGAGRIVAVDTAAWKLELAARLGATDGVNAAEGNPVPRVVEMTAGGVDYAFEAIGLPPTVRQAVRMTRAPREDDPRLPDGLEPLPHGHAPLGRALSEGSAPPRRDDLGPPAARGGERHLRGAAARDGGAERDRLRVGATVSRSAMARPMPLKASGFNGSPHGRRRACGTSVDDIQHR